MDVTFRNDFTVELVEHMGGDYSVCNSARASTSGERITILSEKDKGLINYLMREKHGTPFEGGNSFQFFIEAPIFVVREFMRHRIGFSYSELSGRYKELSPVFYIPDNDRPLVQEGKVGHYTFTNGTEMQTIHTKSAFVDAIVETYSRYTEMLGLGIAKEVARMILPLNIYSSMYVTCNSRSLMNFLTLRTADNALYEIAEVAWAMEELWRPLMPFTWLAYISNGRIAP